MISSPVGPADVAAAHDVLREVLPPTPLLHSRVLSERLGGPVFLKCENLQRTGSFKARGAYLRISRLTEEERARGVVAASAGNHAQGVAFAAESLGVKATVVMPARRAAAQDRGHPGLRRRHHLPRRDGGRRAGVRPAVRRGAAAVLIHPFDHPDIVAGQGTLGLEILEQCPQVRTIAVPVGGGGVAAGITVAVKRRRPEHRGDRGAGRGGRRATRPRWPPGTRSGCGRADHGRRHRGLPARGHPVRHHLRATATGW